MDVTDGLQLLAENSWGTTRQILYEAKGEIEALRDVQSRAIHLANHVDKTAKLDKEELAEAVGIIKASRAIVTS